LVNIKFATDPQIQIFIQLYEIMTETINEIL